MAKLQKISKIALVLLKILKVIAIVLLILGAAASVFLMFIPELASPTALTIGNLELEGLTALTFGDLRPFLAAVLLVFFLNGVVGLRIIFHLKQILLPMTEGRPFQDHTACAIRKIAWLHMITAFLSQAIGSAVTAFTFHRLNLQALLDGSVTGVTLNSQIDGTFLVTFGILLLLSYVFEYGQELQKLSDETV